MKELMTKQKALEQRYGITEVKEVPGNVSGFTSFYDFGTFTPTIVGSTIAGTFTYAATTRGLWTRVGNMVILEGHINITAITVAPTGNLQIGGLPIVATTPDPGALLFSDFTGITLGAGYSVLNARVTASTQLALLIRSGSAVQALTAAGGTLALIAGVAEIVFGGSYRV